MRVFVSFPGFYESDLSDGIDRAIECEAEWFETETGKAPNWHWSDFAVDYDLIAEAYLNEYAKELENSFGVKVALGFVALHSPREYNFETDRLEAEVSDADFLALIEAVKREGLWDGLREHVKAALKPRDGFIPFYSNALDAWGDPLGWELPQTEVFFDYVLNYQDVDVDGAVFNEAVGLPADAA